LKWEGILAGVAAISGLILVSKTTSLRKEAETVVFNARQPKMKLTNISTSYLITDPILKQMITDTSSAYFCISPPHPLEFTIKEGKPISAEIFSPVNKDGKPIEPKFNLNLVKKNYTSRKGQPVTGVSFAKPWKRNNYGYYVAIQAIKDKGLDWKEYVDGGYREYNVKEYFDLNFLPKHEFTDDEIDEILNPAPQEFISLMKDLIVKGQDVNFSIPFLKRYDGKINYFRLNEYFKKLGDFVYDNLSDEEQLKYHILTTRMTNGVAGGYRSLGYFNKRRFIDENFGRPSDEQYDLLIEYWIVLNTLLLYQGYNGFTQKLEDKGYDAEEMILVRNIRHNIDLYRDRMSGVPQRYTTKSGVLSKEDIENISYPLKFIQRTYLKNRAKYEALKRKLQAELEDKLNSNLGSEENDAKKRLIAGAKSKFADYITSVYPKLANNPSAIPSYEFSARILPKIMSDFEISKDLLSESEKKEIFTSYETLTNAQVVEEQTKAEDSANRLIQDWQRKITSQRNQIPVAKQDIKDRGDARISKMKTELGL